MPRQFIPVAELVLPPFAAWDTGWFLLTCGENRPGAFNTMTVAWGSLGWIWGRPLAMVVVRPDRYTYEFMERRGDFSLCAFAPQYREVLRMLGSQSGRDTDKIRQSGLTPISLNQITSPGFDEAELILQCRKTYFHDLDPAHFQADFIAPCYHEDYHRMYFGEVVAAEGVAGYCLAR